MGTSIPERQNAPPTTGPAEKPKPRTETRAKARHKATGASQGARARKRANHGPRPGSKTAKVLHLLQRSHDMDHSDAPHLQANYAEIILRAKESR